MPRYLAPSPHPHCAWNLWLWPADDASLLRAGTQDIWCLFLIYLAFSRFGKIKLGEDDEEPRYNDFTWFTMLFTCGVAVGLYVFGVSEPLYFYRDVYWQSSGMAPHKTDVDNDAQRAQQAIFMAVYHWGIHGWVPYILLALLMGLVSFRWKLPMTIRSCFYPLIGDHAFGLVGDFIDALSISTTTFGVCTSLGLGVTQLAKGMQFLKNIGCSVEDNCKADGGSWDITKYGANNCFTSAGELMDVKDDCKLPWLSTADDTTKALYTIIAIITGIATLSVLSGLDRGIKTLSAFAFTLGAIMLISIMYADNTWYTLNVMVQTTGYYLQHILQVGFDCEAFKGLGIEMQDSAQGGAHNNLLWGSDGSTSAIARLQTAGFELAPMLSSADCGESPNPCTAGFISATLASAIFNGMKTDATAAEKARGLTGRAVLTNFRMSPTSIDTAGDLFEQQAVAYGMGGGDGQPVQCGTGTYVKAADKPACADVGAGGNIAVCTALLAASKAYERPKLPLCPETVVGDTETWGTCSAHKLNCPLTKTYFGDTNPKFMDLWTIFYWAWWSTWSPFVGFFVALISRGRTVRQVIFGGFVCPTLFAIIWFSVIGGLAIKMQRVAEMALQLRPDAVSGALQCAEYYSAAGVPITPAAKKLAEAGYYMLPCMPWDDQLYYLMMPYTNIRGFLHIVLWIGLVIYFLTSSDSGSMTDDIISASGLSASKIPSWQKVFWCFTEGIVAIALVAASNGGALKTLRSVSIIIGLPFTILLCMMVPSLYRALKRELGEEDIIESMRFNTQLLDIFELFKPNGGSPCTPMTHVKCIVTNLFIPAKGLYEAFVACYPQSPIWAVIVAGFGQFLYVMWFALQIVEVEKAGAHTIGWLCMTALFMLIAFGRGELRRKHNIWGSPLEDLFCAMMLYPITLAQMEMQATTNGKDAPTYFASADEVQAQMTSLSTKNALPTVAAGSSAEIKTSSA